MPQMLNQIPLLGIDFGTTHSSMAWFNPKSGQAEIIRNSDGEEKTPSVVYYGEHEVLVGSAAEELLAEEDERDRVLVNVKRQLAKPIQYAVGGGQVAPIKVVADILGKLKHDAEEGHFREPVEQVVLTHPAAFDQFENDLLIEAAKLAGFVEVKLLPEPVAAAIAYAEAGRRVGDNVLVFDFGGGTFDLAMLSKSFDPKSYDLALDPRGIRLGGEDLDRVLYDHCDEIASKRLGRGIAMDNQRDQGFLYKCRKRKERLSTRSQAEFGTYLHGGIHFKYAIGKEVFEELIGPVIQPAIDLTRQVYDEAVSEGLPPESVVLIGGSSQIPFIRQSLTEAIPIEPITWQGRDYAVALGAASYARKTWMKCWQTDPIDAACPGCQSCFSTNFFGVIACEACRWEFEIDNQGTVIAGWPIASSCPNCSIKLKLRKAGPNHCDGCDWDFEADEEGNVVAGEPIRVACPRCNVRWHAKSSGETDCAECSWNFTFDETGAVIAGIPIIHRCPNCDQEGKARNPGGVRCSKCDWKYDINASGEVTDGEPIIVFCCVCDSRMHCRHSGWVSCSDCGSRFRIDSDGENLDLLRMRLLSNLADDELLQRYIARRSPKMRTEDREMALAKLCMGGMMQCWNRYSFSAATGGYVSGAYGGVLLGLALVFMSMGNASTAAVTWALRLWFIGVGLVIVCFIAGVDRAKAEEIRDNFHKFVSEAYGSVSGFGGCVYFIIFLACGLIGFILAPLLVAAVGAGVGYVVGLLISVVFGLSKGVLRGGVVRRSLASRA